MPGDPQVAPPPSIPSRPRYVRFPPSPGAGCELHGVTLVKPAGFIASPEKALLTGYCTRRPPEIPAVQALQALGSLTRLCSKGWRIGAQAKTSNGRAGHPGTGRAAEGGYRRMNEFLVDLLRRRPRGATSNLATGVPQARLLERCRARGDDPAPSGRTALRFLSG